MKYKPTANDYEPLPSGARLDQEEQWKKPTGDLGYIPEPRLFDERDRECRASQKYHGNDHRG